MAKFVEKLQRIWWIGKVVRILQTILTCIAFLLVGIALGAKEDKSTWVLVSWIFSFLMILFVMAEVILFHTNGGCALLGHPITGIVGSDARGSFNSCRCGRKHRYIGGNQN